MLKIGLAEEVPNRSSKQKSWHSVVNHRFSGTGSTTVCKNDMISTISSHDNALSALIREDKG